jgi:hypothetical protein
LNAVRATLPGAGKTWGDSHPAWASHSQPARTTRGAIQEMINNRFLPIACEREKPVARTLLASASAKSVMVSSMLVMLIPVFSPSTKRGRWSADQLVRKQ